VHNCASVSAAIGSADSSYMHMFFGAAVRVNAWISTGQVSANHSSAQFFSFVGSCQVFYCVITRCTAVAGAHRI
jgi:hypothetical protein